MSSTDIEWERWGAEDPYFGVLTDNRFRSDNLTDQNRVRFFDTGVQHVEHVLAVCAERLGAQLRPGTALEFGCGVGRVALPLSRYFARVDALDVSPSMLAEAQRNAEAAGISNIVFLQSDDMLSAAPEKYDFVHSTIVLQHLDVPRGRVLFETLVSKVAPGGFGVLHVTFAQAGFDDTFGREPPPAPPQAEAKTLRSQLARAKQLIMGVSRKPSAPEVPVPHRREPEMRMNYYELSDLAFVLQRHRVPSVHLEFTDHGGALGAHFYFFRPLCH
jgi:SAM-dependent methyltransferase